jgi:flagellum-specific peptidoglycan hydrolase FlgJ
MMTMITKVPENVWAACVLAEKTTKCPAYLTAAQWAQESGWGQYLSAPFNPFGIKWVTGCGYAFRTSYTKEELPDGTYITIQANFVAFPSWLEAFEYHGRLLTQPQGPYWSALKYAWIDWQKYIDVVGAIYATDHNYAADLIKIIQTSGISVLKST